MRQLSKKDVAFITENKFVRISLLGRGKDGELWYGLPRSSVPTSQKTGDGLSDSSIVALKAKVVAVKIHKGRYGAFDNAVKALTCIHKPKNPEESTTTTQSSRFVKILDMKATPPAPSWMKVPSWMLTTAAELGLSNPWFSDNPTIPRSYFPMNLVQGINIRQLLECLDHPSQSQSHRTVPEELTANIACQGHDALRWIHERGSRHSVNILDLGSPNIMLDFVHQDVAGLPNIVFIDCWNAMLDGGRG